MLKAANSNNCQTSIGEIEHIADESRYEMVVYSENRIEVVAVSYENTEFGSGSATVDTRFQARRVINAVRLATIETTLQAVDR